MKQGAKKPSNTVNKSLISKTGTQPQIASTNNEPVAQEAMLSAPKPPKEEVKDPDLIEDLGKDKAKPSESSNGEQNGTTSASDSAPVGEKSRIEIMQERQKLIEEDNKRKKALLAKAIADRCG